MERALALALEQQRHVGLMSPLNELNSSEPAAAAGKCTSMSPLNVLADSD
jgi:hypothetical protein